MHEKNPFLEPCYTHMQILTIIENKVNNIVKNMARENFLQAAKKSKKDAGSDNDEENDNDVENKNDEDFDDNISQGSDKVNEAIFGTTHGVGLLTAKSEAIHNSMIFFLLSIGKNKKIDMEKDMGVRVVAE
jgi:hypothetical protein